MPLMLQVDGLGRAERVASMVPVVASEKADWAAVDDWMSAQTRDDYVLMLRSMEAWTDGPEWNRVVVVRPRMRPDGTSWSYAASEVLDTAVDRVDTDLGDNYSFEHGRIEPDPGSQYGAMMVWERKPNLERAFHGLWRGQDPMVGVTLDGVEYFLNWDQQRMAATVANREHVRHVYSAKIYAKTLLLLARSMRIDTYTARRLTNLVVPDHCGVSLERNTALRILSAEEELEIVVSRDTYYADMLGLDVAA